MHKVQMYDIYMYEGNYPPPAEPAVFYLSSVLLLFSEINSLLFYPFVLFSIYLLPPPSLAFNLCALSLPALMYPFFLISR